MSEQEKQHCVKNHPTFGTGSLLLITTWASLCFTAIFVSQSLFLFQVSRLMGMSAVVMSAIVPLFLKLKNRKFWNAYSVAILVYLSYSFMHEYANPIVSEVAVDVCRLLRADGPYSPGIRGVDYFTGTIGTFTAIYFFLEMHFVVLLGLLAGALWENLKDQTPLWVVGAWVLLVAMEITEDVGLSLGFLSAIATVALLPTFSNYEGAYRPFWTSFGVFAFIVGIEAVTSMSYDFTCHVNEIVSVIAPLSSARMAESITFIGVPIVAAVVGLIVQIIVQNVEPSALRLDD